MNIIKRHIENDLKDLLFTSSKEPQNAIIVQGARQVGKSTLIETVLENAPDVVRANLEENKILRDQIEKTTSFQEFELCLASFLGFSPQRSKILYFDEAQESQVLGSYVRFMKEKWPGVRTVLSGSSMTRLFHDDQRIPVGRITYFKVNPFNFSEFLLCRGKEILLNYINNFPKALSIPAIIHQELLSELDLFLNIGGLPQVVTSFCANKDYINLRKDIFLSQQEDFVRKSGFRKTHLFSEALTGIATNLGFPSKYTHIAQRSADAKQIVEVLKNWHLVLEIEQRGINSTTSFHPKRYIYDIGVAQVVRKHPFVLPKLTDASDPVLRTSLGGILENFTLLSLENYGGSAFEFSSWRKNSNQPIEVDFVWNCKYPIPIECKSALKISRNTFSNIKAWLDTAGQRVGFLISPAPFTITKEQQKLLINLPPYLAKREIISDLAKSHS